MSTITYDDLSTEITVCGSNGRSQLLNFPQDADTMHIAPIGKTGMNLVTFYDVMGNVLWRRHTASTLVFQPHEATHFTPLSTPVSAEAFLPDRNDGELYLGGFRVDDIEFEEVAR